MNETELTRIAAAVNQLRPDWPVASLRTILGSPSIIDRPRRDVAVAFAWIACDAATKTPGRIKEHGPWWLAATAEGGTYRPNLPPCPEHPDQTLPCGRCRHEAERADVAAGLERLRAAQEAAREALCPCGTPRENCNDHRPAQPERTT